MLNQQGNELQLSHFNQQFQNEVQYPYCRNHEVYYKTQCYFCSENAPLETFLSKINGDQRINFVIIDIAEVLDKQLYNAGISSYDQFINANAISELKAQGKMPHEIAIELGMYTQKELDALIGAELEKRMVQENDIELTLDLWSISRTTTYLMRAKELTRYLNLSNSIILYPSDRIQIIQSVDDQGKFEDQIDQNIITQIATTIKGDKRNMTRKSKFPGKNQNQAKRILSVLLKPIANQPFSGEVVYITDAVNDLEAYAKKFELQKTPLHIFCPEEMLQHYYNIGGLTGGQIREINTVEFKTPTFKVRMVISKQYIFTESCSNVIEADVEDQNAFSVHFQEVEQSDKDGVVQVIMFQQNGTCIVEQTSLEKHQVIEQEQSENSQSTLKLTDYSKS